jgi:hypothetical protein
MGINADPHRKQQPDSNMMPTKTDQAQKMNAAAKASAGKGDMARNSIILTNNQK